MLGHSRTQWLLDVCLGFLYMNISLFQGDWQILFKQVPAFSLALCSFSQSVPLLPVPATQKRSHSMKPPEPCFTGGMFPLKSLIRQQNYLPHALEHTLEHFGRKQNASRHHICITYPTLTLMISRHAERFGFIYSAPPELAWLIYRAHSRLSFGTVFEYKNSKLSTARSVNYLE